MSSYNELRAQTLKIRYLGILEQHKSELDQARQVQTDAQNKVNQTTQKIGLLTQIINFPDSEASQLFDGLGSQKFVFCSFLGPDHLPGKQILLDPNTDGTLFSRIVAASDFAAALQGDHVEMSLAVDGVNYHNSSTQGAKFPVGTDFSPVPGGNFGIVDDVSGKSLKINCDLSAPASPKFKLAWV